MLAYCFLYMKPALKQYLKGSKTIAQTRENKDQPNPPPVLIVCSYPPFKNSFFKNHGLDGIGAEKYFWKVPQHWEMFKNSFSYSHGYLYDYVLQIRNGLANAF